MWNVMKLLMSFVFFCNTFQIVLCKAYVQIQLRTYLNSKGDLLNGVCCYEQKFCTIDCDHNFILCLDQIDGKSNEISSCPYGSDETGPIRNKNYITFNTSSRGLFNWTLNVWPGAVLLKIKVMNGLKQNNKVVDIFQKAFNLLPGHNENVQLVSRTTITLDFRVTCEANHFSHNCSVYCRPDPRGHYTCNKLDGTKICLQDWMGPNCDVSSDDCHLVSCRNGGWCRDGISDFTCICPEGFTGRLCEADIDECLNRSKCANGDCVNSFGNYSCRCHKGYAGKECAINIDECASSPCLNGAMCIDMVATYSCNCATGFKGLHCTEDLNECDYFPCKYGATCTNFFGSFACECMPGFQGLDCSRDINECELDLCRNGGTCKNFIGGYKCHCTVGYTGRNCESDVNECILPKGKCKNGATCLNTVGSFACSCLPGYYGPYCQHDVNECSKSPCKHRSVCKNLPGSFRCICRQGYTGKYCEFDIDECLSGVCQNGGICHNLEGSYHCSCSDFWEGQNCDVNVNECESLPCLNNATCLDTGQGYSCTCQEGYLGELCELDLDECEMKVCANNATCYNTVGSFRCGCLAGWTGKRCEVDVDECKLSLCNNWGECVNTNGSYYCHCPRNWVGQNCELDLDECELNENDPCKNGGTCINMQGSFRCQCPPEWSGRLCELDIEECEQIPDACRIIGKYDNGSLNVGARARAKSNAKCVNSEPGYWCVCPDGWTGWNCDMDINECDVGVVNSETKYITDCLNELSCMSLRDMIASDEMADYVGHFGGHVRANSLLYFNRRLKSREVSLPFFRPACLHGATCVNEQGGYHCECSVNYSGKRCENVHCDLVAGEECSSHGKCVISDHVASCICSPGWTGKNCESKWQCFSNPCQNGGSCEDGLTLASFACRCIEGWKGALCQICTEKSCKKDDLCLEASDCDLDNVTAVHNVTAAIMENSVVFEVTKRFDRETTSATARDADGTDLCSNDYCFKNGACFQTYGEEKRCRCPESWSERRCDGNSENVPTTSASPVRKKTEDVCSGVVCQNNGSCLQSGNSWLCSCTEHWGGDFCENHLTSCPPNACHGHGNCSLTIDKEVRCFCDPAWTGHYCDVGVDHCTIEPCKNKGVCTLTKRGHSCRCQGMWSGPDCTLIELSLPFYLSCNVTPTMAWTVDKGLADMLMATNLYGDSKVEVSHKSQKGRTPDGKVLTAIVPSVRVDDSILTQQEIVYALNMMSSKFKEYMYCPLYLDAVERSQFKFTNDLLNVQADNWYPGLISVCVFLFIGMTSLTIIKCRRMYHQRQARDQLGRSKVTLSFRNRLYRTETNASHFQEMVENQINIISSGTVSSVSPHYATVDEMREIQAEDNTVTRVDVELRENSADGQPTRVTQPLSVTKVLERPRMSTENQLEQVNLKTNSRNQSSARSKQATSPIKQDPLPALPKCAYYNDSFYMSPASSLGRSTPTKTPPSSVVGPDGAAKAEAALYVDMGRRKKSGIFRQRPRSLDEKRVYKKRGSRDRKRFSDVDRKYKYLPYIDDPPYHDTLVRPHAHPST